jgi:hypothetical protein
MFTATIEAMLMLVLCLALFMGVACAMFSGLWSRVAEALFGVSAQD